MYDFPTIFICFPSVANDAQETSINLWHFQSFLKRKYKLFNTKTNERTNQSVLKSAFISSTLRIHSCIIVNNGWNDQNAKLSKYVESIFCSNNKMVLFIVGVFRLFWFSSVPWQSTSQRKSVGPRSNCCSMLHVLLALACMFRTQPMRSPWGSRCVDPNSS